MDKNINLGQKIKAEREKRNITYYSFWKRLGMPAATVKRVEDMKGSMANMIKVCDFIGIKVDISSLERNKVD